MLSGAAAAVCVFCDITLVVRFIIYYVYLFKHIINTIKLTSYETEIVKAGLLEGARIGWAKELKCPESSISDETALQGILFLNEDMTIKRVN